MDGWLDTRTDEQTKDLQMVDGRMSTLVGEMDTWIDEQAEGAEKPGL